VEPAASGNRECRNFFGFRDHATIGGVGKEEEEKEEEEEEEVVVEEDGTSLRTVMH
jgi:CO dehydrogenase/acetyl-CoA synthase beta subunit